MEEQQRNEIKEKLKYILGISQCNHKIEIMKEDNIKRAHIYCKINQLSGQVSGPLHQPKRKNETKLL
jgi:hypothetical protein